MPLLRKLSANPLLLSIILCSAGPADAAPPASCARKFVGVWTYPGGTTRVDADGTAYPTCFMCVTKQSWTCNGDTYYFESGGIKFTAILSAGGTQLVGSGVTATRADGAAAAPSAPRSSASARPPTKSDARACLTVKSVGRATYGIVNSCNAQVNFVVETMENHPKKTVRDSLYVGARGTESPVYSYHAFRPRIISATSR